MNKTDARRAQRIRRSRARASGTKERPRLSVFRSNKNVYLQLIDDNAGATLAYASTEELKDKKKTKSDMSFEAGKLLAERAKKIGIKSAVFDRRYYKYHGRVKSVADGAREEGLII